MKDLVVYSTQSPDGTQWIDTNSPIDLSATDPAALKAFIDLAGSVAEEPGVQEAIDRKWREQQQHGRRAVTTNAVTAPAPGASANGDVAGTRSRGVGGDTRSSPSGEQPRCRPRHRARYPERIPAVARESDGALSPAGVEVFS